MHQAAAFRRAIQQAKTNNRAWELANTHETAASVDAAAAGASLGASAAKSPEDFFGKRTKAVRVAPNQIVIGVVMDCGADGEFLYLADDESEHVQQLMAAVQKLIERAGMRSRRAAIEYRDVQTIGGSRDGAVQMQVQLSIMGAQGKPKMEFVILSTEGAVRRYSLYPVGKMQWNVN
jgi:hypothetical protein